jgi:hypothetical protein
MTTTVPSRSRRLLATVLPAVAAVLTLGIAAVPAGAHDGDAVITVEAVHPAGQSIHYIVRVTWQNDGHAAVDATVTATGIAADGTQLTPVPLAPADADGRYSGAVEYPAAGAWTVRITAIDPTGTIEQPQDVVATATTQAPNVTTGAPADGGFAPADDGTGDSAEGDATATDEPEGASPETDAGADGSSDSGDFPILLVVAAAAVVVLGAVTAVNIIRRTKANPPGGAAGTSGDGGDSGPDADSGAGDPDPDPGAEQPGAGAPSEPTTTG